VVVGSATRKRGGDQTKKPTTTMTHEKLKAAFLQGGEREATELFNELIRGSVREAFWQMMAEEVEVLCGPHYRPDKTSEYRRAGSENGSVYLGGDKEEIRRPRVRHQDDGEMPLETYRAASSQTGLFEKIVGLVGEGMSQRGVARSTKGTISKSAVSRMWEDKSREQLSLVRARPLDQVQWLAVMIDGVFIGTKGCVVIAIGIDESGRKQALDFEPGDSESQETVNRLISRLKERGVEAEKGSRLLVLRDGSKAIAGAVRRCWPDALQQACLVHVERNIADRLRRRDRSESQRLFKCLRQAEGKQAGEEAFEDLREFLAERNAVAALALSDRGDEILCVHRLGIPATLNLSFLSTNMIENVIRNWREHTNNIKRWTVKNDMIERWAASGLLWAEGGFRRIRHYEDLPKLREALARSLVDSASTTGSSLRSEPSVPTESASEIPS
jgi:putative transposase